MLLSFDKISYILDLRKLKLKIYWNIISIKLIRWNKFYLKMKSGELSSHLKYVNLSGI